MLFFLFFFPSNDYLNLMTMSYGKYISEIQKRSQFRIHVLCLMLMWQGTTRMTNTRQV